MSELATVKVHNWKKGGSGYLIINERDFSPKAGHKLWGEEDEAVNLKAMSKQQLVEYAANAHGVELEMKLSKQALVEAVAALEEGDE